MTIDRTNYEIWFIDWLDNNLSQRQIEQLNLFLNENPDLKEEFDELSRCNLIPSLKTYSKKDLLKKSISDIADSQFEYTCVAYLEKDLSEDQQSELTELIENSPEKKKKFDLIQKIRLTPSDIKFNYKNSLLKRTTAQKVLRLSAWSLSAAAAIALLITTYLTIPSDDTDDLNNLAININVDSTRILKSSENILKEKVPEEKRVQRALQRTDNILVAENMTTGSSSVIDTPQLVSNDSAISDRESRQAGLQKISFNSAVNLKGIFLSNTLVASNTLLDLPEYDDERSNFSKFLAKAFREKILKDETTPDSPLKGYEIAEAGVTGLNKLLGWDMALVKNNDENGELNSVYFSSRILKFNAPVKKSAPIP